ncbi:hypothetical protein SteCoe_31206 [Stentor coeruleus]|uniref:Phospho-2-dehydro-3-deoxyheptonate aldolase n=1 Tax=Stentor coeruleus TaxID=5963 RepID=A0A1R2B1Y3_9CILI|nr:hypothetical protein SteCoe_31206 [Stentor coeruleus]
MQRPWLSLPCVQQPDYQSSESLQRASNFLSEAPGLITYQEIQSLKSHLASSAEGSSFILQIGDCAEAFSDCTHNLLTSKISQYTAYANHLQQCLNKPIVLIGRIAGQFCKPRSEPYETINGRQVLSYKGDMVNSISLDNREPDPERLIKSYFLSATVHNFIRANEPSMFTSHEALHMIYENSMTKYHDGKFMNFGAHFVWLGERTRKLGQAHAEYLSHIDNPVGIKVGPNADLNELIEIINKVNIQNQLGKVALIIRLGIKNYKSQLGMIIDKVKESGKKVVWMIDPLHGNTYKSSTGFKTRDFTTVVEETLGCIEIIRKNNEIVAGLHLEVSFRDVTEVVGLGVCDEDLGNCYETLCDPRLNPKQTIALLSEVAVALK